MRHVIINIPPPLAQRCVWPGQGRGAGCCSGPPAAGSGRGGWAEVGTERPSPPLAEVSLWIPVTLWGAYAHTAPALYGEELWSYKSLLFKH